MSSFSFIMLLIAMAFISLVTVFLVTLLDVFSSKSSQKILLLKSGLLLHLASPIAALNFSYFSLPSEVIKLTYNNIPTQVKQIGAWQNASMAKDWLWVLALTHVSACTFLLLRILYSYAISKRQLKGSECSVVNGRIIWLNKKILSPLSFGIWQGKIYAPAEIESALSKREIELALAHEQAHIKNRDPLWKLISLIVRSLLFFAPWAYLFHNKLMLEMETCCDEEAREITKSDVFEYGSFLLGMALKCSPNFIAANFTGSTLKRRIIAMKRKTKYRPVLTSSLCILLMAISGISTGSIANPSKSVENIIVSSKIYLDGVIVSSPTIKTSANRKGQIIVENEDKQEGLNLSVAPASNAHGQFNIPIEIELTESGKKFAATTEILLNPDQSGEVKFQTSWGKELKIQISARIE
jgi:beta-lactamase regulating signal transducer with metallopeptidase domain